MKRQKLITLKKVQSNLAWDMKYTRNYEKDFMVDEVNCLPQMTHSIYVIFIWIEITIWTFFNPHILFRIIFH